MTDQLCPGCPGDPNETCCKPELRVKVWMDKQKADMSEQKTQIPLAEGEIYAGLIGNANGEAYHLIMLPGDNDGATWQAQLEWAKSIGGDLPDRVEQALLFKHFKSEFQERAYWSNTPCEPDDDEEESSWAWCQGFDGGVQDLSHKGYEFRSRAVRRLPI